MQQSLIWVHWIVASVQLDRSCHDTYSKRWVDFVSSFDALMNWLETNSWCLLVQSVGLKASSSSMAVGDTSLRYISQDMEIYPTFGHGSGSNTKPGVIISLALLKRDDFLFRYCSNRIKYRSRWGFDKLRTEGKHEDKAKWNATLFHRFEFLWLSKESRGK